MAKVLPKSIVLYTIFRVFSYMQKLMIISIVVSTLLIGKAPIIKILFTLDAFMIKQT
jgi:hypothetical protein